MAVLLMLQSGAAKGHGKYNGATMTPQETATKLLEYFGPEGEHWRRGAGKFGHKCCVVVAAVGLWDTDDGYDPIALYEQLRAAAGVTPTTDIGNWNDRSDWPTVKAALEKVRDAT